MRVLGERWLRWSRVPPHGILQHSGERTCAMVGVQKLRNTVKISRFREIRRVRKMPNGEMLNVHAPDQPAVFWNLLLKRCPERSIRR